MHLGASVCAIEKKGYRTDKGSLNRKILLKNADKEIEKVKALLSEIKNDRNAIIKDTIEITVGCSISEMVFAESKNYSDSDWEQFKTLAENAGIKFFAVIMKSGKQIAYFDKREKDKLMKIQQQLYIKEKQPEKQQDKAIKKRHTL